MPQGVSKSNFQNENNEMKKYVQENIILIKWRETGNQLILKFKDVFIKEKIMLDNS